MIRLRDALRHWGTVILAIGNRCYRFAAPRWLDGSPRSIPDLVTGHPVAWSCGRWHSTWNPPKGRSTIRIRAGVVLLTSSALAYGGCTTSAFLRVEDGPLSAGIQTEIVKR